MRHARAISRIGIQRISNWWVGGRSSRALRLHRNNRPAIPGLHPIARERHGREQRSAIAIKLTFGYLNFRPTNILVKYSTKGVAILYYVPRGGGQLLKRSFVFWTILVRFMVGKFGQPDISLNPNLNLRHVISKS